MPTGYTAGVQDGTIKTLKEFTLLCARAFGALVHMRDDPLSSEIKNSELSPYCKEQLEHCVAQLSELFSLSTTELQALYEKERSIRLSDAEEQIAKKQKSEKLYREMLKKVEHWIPPSMEHQGLKTYMIEQLEESIRFDCDIRFYQAIHVPNFDVWLKEKRKSLEHNIDYFTKEWENEQKRNADRNAWIEALKKSLE